MSELEILKRALAAIEVFKPYMDGWRQIQSIAYAKKCAEIMLRNEQQGYLSEKDAVWRDARGKTRSYPTEQKMRLSQKCHELELIIKKINEL